MDPEVDSPRMETRRTTLQAYRERGKEALFPSACRMVSAAGSPQQVAEDVTGGGGVCAPKGGGAISC